MYRLRALAAAAILAMLPVSPATAAGPCTDNWSEMANMVTANKLAPASSLSALARTKVTGKLIKVSLCQAYGGFQYQLVFLQPGGQLVTVTTDAGNPFPQ